MKMQRPHDGAGMPGDDPHASWERLNDFVDGRLDDDSAGTVRVHLAECRACRDAAEALRGLSREARRLETSLEPDDALWGEIAGVIAAGGGGDAHIRVERSGPGMPDDAHPRDVRAHGGRPARSASPRWLAAAAVVLMALSSGITALVMRDRGAGAADTARPGGGVAALPASFAATERAFLADVAALDALLDTQRPSLAPATIAVVERSLATIDAAIAEARAALLADPANVQLVELLAASYRQKVELMRRAAEFPNSI